MAEASVKVTRITHCCTLIDFSGEVVLTDPWFSERFGYYRGEALGGALADLPPLAGVLVSHDHYDHNDMRAFSGYRDRGVTVLAEAAAARRARSAGFGNAKALETWGKAQLKDILVTAVPALHGVPEVGFVAQAAGFTVYFGGDTMLIPELSRLASDFPPIDIALLPINGLRVLGKQVVMDPLQAADLCAMLKPRVAIPTHYAFTGGWLMDGLFLKYFAEQQRLTELFKEAMVKTKTDTQVVVLTPGASFTATHP